jgi:hypothetical protein
MEKQKLKTNDMDIQELPFLTRIYFSPFALYVLKILDCNDSMLKSGSESSCIEFPDIGSNLLHDAMLTWQHRLTLSSLR